MSGFKRSLKYVTTIAVVIGAILYQVSINSRSLSKNVVPRKKIFSVAELSRYDGVQQRQLYLAVIGNVFDVTKGSEHYERGSPYYYFIGKDGTRALATGNFKDESKSKDHILDLPCNDLLTIMQWRQTFKKKYTFVGVLADRYYDEKGENTIYMSNLIEKVKKCRAEKEEAKKLDQLYPPCNIAWSADDGAKVWCTKSSGGVARDWVGVPRQMFSPGQEKPLCVCVNKDETNSSQLKEYNGCPKTSTECLIYDK